MRSNAEATFRVRTFLGGGGDVLHADQKQHGRSQNQRLRPHHRSAWNTSLRTHDQRRPEPTSWLGHRSTLSKHSLLIEIDECRVASIRIWIRRWLWRGSPSAALVLTTGKPHCAQLRTSDCRLAHRELLGLRGWRRWRQPAAALRARAQHPYPSCKFRCLWHLHSTSNTQNIVAYITLT